MKKLDLSKQPHLSKRLAEALEAPGLSQAGLAKACEIKAASVSDWVTGKTKSISAVNAVRAARYLGVCVAWLVLEELPKRPDIDTDDLRAALQRCSDAADRAIIEAGRIAADQVLDADTDRDSKGRGRDARMALHLVLRLRAEVERACREQ